MSNQERETLSPSPDTLVTAMMKRLGRLVSDGAVEDLERLVDERVGLMLPGLPRVDGRDAAAETIRLWHRGRIRDLSVRCEDMDIRGDIGICSGRLYLKTVRRSSGTTRYWEGKFLAAVVRRDGTWLINRFCCNANLTEAGTDPLLEP